ncbi:hypothetical protein [Sphingobium tyrosinilyticum]|uniref:Helix-turn-helix domain-containing protein n=1 Tax=Sphingobium tyrosinilyticum TaxID=2715436 RepID=A0ABV9F019_9SPHN
MAGGKRRALHEIRNYGSREYSLIPHGVFWHQAVTSLSDRAFRALFVIQSCFRGSNNGNIQVPARWLAEQMGTQNYASVADAVDELVQHGLIVITFDPKKGQREARKYRLTYATYGPPSGILDATHDWRNWMPGDVAAKRPKRGNRKHSRIEDASTQSVEHASTDRKLSVEDASTQGHGNTRSFRSSCVEDASKNLIYHSRPASSSVSSFRPSSVSTPAALSHATDPFMESGELREWVLQAIEGMMGARARLAGEANVPKGTLSKFLGGANLPRHHRISVQQALPRVVAAMRSNSAGNGAG